MSFTSMIDRLATYFIVVMFLLGVWEATNMIQSDTPWYKEVYAESVNGDFTKIIDMSKMATGWAIVTPTIHVSQLPWYIGWYGAYYAIIMPSGYIPIPSTEMFIFISLVLLLIVLPLAIITKRAVKKKMQESKTPQIGLLGLPWWFYISIPILMLLLYPLFCWFGLELFKHGAASFFNISLESAESIWINFGEKTQGFTVFLVIVSVLGLYKGVKWSGKAKVF